MFHGICLRPLCPEAPEEEYDPRSLFDRLQEQKDKKQEEYEEQFKFSEFHTNTVSEVQLCRSSSEADIKLHLRVFFLILFLNSDRLRLLVRWLIALYYDGFVVVAAAAVFFKRMFVSMATENMVRGLDQDETSFLDEVSRQQCLVEKQRRDEEKQELLEYRISFQPECVFNRPMVVVGYC